MENFKMEEPGHGQMKNLDRGKQLETTILGKKIEQLLTNKSQFISKINDYLSKQEDIQVAEEDQLQKIVEGRDINVAIRARPLLDYEVQ